MSRAEPRPARFGAGISLALLFALCVPAFVLRAEAPSDERADQVKAAYLINFLRYTDWPQGSFPTRDSPFHILVVGRPELLDAVRTLAAAAGNIGGRAITIERMTLPDPGTGSGSGLRAQLAERLRSCHLLFIERNERERAGDLLSLVRDFPVLTVSDVDNFAQSGGMLELLPRGANIVLAANPGAIRRSDLMVSAKVLKIARVVGDEEAPR